MLQRFPGCRPPESSELQCRDCKGTGLYLPLVGPAEICRLCVGTGRGWPVGTVDAASGKDVSGSPAAVER